MIIGLAGKFGSGKDEVGLALENCGQFKRLSFAEALRKETAPFTRPGTFSPKEMPLDLWTDLTSLFTSWPDKPITVYDKPTHPVVRRLLQWWGTEYRRRQDPDYWVKAIMPKVWILTDLGHDLVFTDVRFANEAEYIKSIGGKLWLVKRNIPVTGEHSHISEQFCDTYKDWDLILDNNGTLDELYTKVRNIMRCESELQRIDNSFTLTNTPGESLGLTLGQADWITERSLIAQQ